MVSPPSALTPTQLGAYLSFTEVAALLRPAVEQQLRDAGELSTCSSSCSPGWAMRRTGGCG